MMSVRLPRTAFLALGLLVVLLLGVACAKAEEKAAPAPVAPAQAPAAAPAAAPAPAAPTPAPTAAPAPAPAPAAPVAAPSPERGARVFQEGPQVPGAPPFLASEVAKYKGWQILDKYHYNKLPLWTRAKYGGHHFTHIYAFASLAYRLHTVQVLNRPSIAGMMLYVDSGRCSLIGREDFSVCKGEYAHNNGLVIVPGIFQRWEQPSPTSYIFHMRKGVLWPATPPMARTDREMTAEDIVFFLEATKKDGITRQNFVLAKRFEALDRYTVKITMEEPQADFLLHLAHTSQGIFPRECYEEKDCLGTIKSVSPGPLLVKEHELRNKLVLEKNQEFYLKGLPYIDGLTVLNIFDPAAVDAAFTTAKLDVGIPAVLEQAEAVLKRVPGSQLQTIGGTGAVTGALRPQLKGPLADVRVRRALAMTMDHRTMWEVGIGGFSMLSPLVSRHYFGEDFYYTVEQLGENYVFNPTRAKQLLAEAGYGDGFDLTVTSTSTSGYGYNYMVFLQAQWKRHLGVNLKIKNIDTAARTDLYQKGTWDGLFDTMCCWILSCWGTADDFFAQFVKGSPGNIQSIDDPVMEDLYRRARSELDPAKRNRILWETEQYETSQVYQLRTGFCSNFTNMQPWEMNGASHGTMYFVVLNGPTWLAMHDTSKYPPGRR